MKDLVTEPARLLQGRQLAGSGWVRLPSAATSTLGLALILLKTFIH